MSSRLGPENTRVAAPNVCGWKGAAHEEGKATTGEPTPARSLRGLPVTLQMVWRRKVYEY
jgi:hypothetical protein